MNFTAKKLHDKEIAKSTAKTDDESAIEQIEKVKKKRGHNPASIDAYSTASKDDIREIMANSLFWYNKKPVQTDEECVERLNEFFQRLAETGEIPTVEKMCLALATPRQRVWEWEQGTKGEVRSDIVKQAKSILASLDAELVSRGKIPQITYIFRAKNFFGMSDKQEYVITPNNSIGSPSNPEDTASRYSEALPESIMFESGPKVK